MVLFIYNFNTTIFINISLFKYFFRKPMRKNDLCKERGTRKKTLLYTLKPSSSQATKSHTGKAKTVNQRPWIKQYCLWNKREKSYYFTHPTQDTTNSHSHFNQKERMGTWEKKESYTKKSKNKRKVKKSK